MHYVIIHSDSVIFLCIYSKDGRTAEPCSGLDATFATTANRKKSKWFDWFSPWTVRRFTLVSWPTFKNSPRQERRKRLLIMWLQPWWRFLPVWTVCTFCLHLLFASSRPSSSPWSNTYEPTLEDGTLPTERLRKLEIEANTAFDQYRQMYFEGGVSSVYLWDLEHGFAG